VGEYKKALNFVALNYPNNIEGKQAEEIIKKDIPVLESYKFYAVAPKSWKIVYKVPHNDEKNNVVEEFTFTLPGEEDDQQTAPTVEIFEPTEANNTLLKADSDNYAPISYGNYEVKLATQSKKYTNVSNEISEQAGEVVSSYTTTVDHELLTMFIEEAHEILPEIGIELRAWRSHPKQSEHPDALQRALHTLKGSARMAGQSGLGDAVHEMEDLVIRSLKRNIKNKIFRNNLL
jgi:chemosensory pili system protein ChpA (sensor histidine kinase/response regulator)